MTISSKAKAATLIGVVITIVTLALVTALVIVNMMPVQKAAATCVINPKNEYGHAVVMVVASL